MYKVACTGQKQNEVEVYVYFIGEQGRHKKQGSVHLWIGWITVRKSKRKCNANMKV